MNDVVERPLEYLLSEYSRDHSNSEKFNMIWEAVRQLSSKDQKEAYRLMRIEEVHKKGEKEIDEINEALGYKIPWEEEGGHGIPVDRGGEGPLSCAMTGEQ